jgi:hypothetical protein
MKVTIGGVGKSYEEAKTQAIAKASAKDSKLALARVHTRRVRRPLPAMPWKGDEQPVTIGLVRTFYFK